MATQPLAVSSPQTSRLFARDICVGASSNLARSLEDALAAGHVSVFFCNVHMLMASQEDKALSAAMEHATLVLPDGIPVAWLQRRLGFRGAGVLRGESALDLVCRAAASSSRRIGFFGSTEETLARLTRNLSARYDGLQVDYLCAPPKLADEIILDASLVKEINERNLCCLFVGLGCPKQEKWVSVYAPHLNCNLLAIGAVFDWAAGTVGQPPQWLVKHGMAWFYRLVQNPRRMWFRYLKYNTKFVLMATSLLASRHRRLNSIPRSQE